MAHFVLEPILFQSGSLASNFTSNMLQAKYGEYVSIQLNWSGTPTGTFALLGSLDNVNYTPLKLSNVIAPVGGTDFGIIDMIGTGIPYFQIQYTAVSGTGTVAIYLCYKQI